MWQEKEGNDGEITDVASLQADNFCVVYELCWGGPGSCAVSMLTPEYFTGAADFLAWLRVVDLPRALRLMTGVDETSRAVAEDWRGDLTEEELPRLDGLITAIDEGLSHAEPGRAEAEAALGAYNALFGRHGDARFLAWGRWSDVLRAERIQASFDGVYDADTPEAELLRQARENALDPTDEKQLAVAREILAIYPLC